MVWFLLGTSVLFAFVGEWTEAIIMLVALLPFLGMDAFLHRRTHASTAGLSSRLASVASVLRNGATVTLAATELVPGDLVVVGVGEAFPADGLVVRGEELQADESALTGEAYPVHKLPLAELARLDGEAKVDSQHWGFAGTRLLTGKAWLRVIHTGGETLYGEIVRSATRGRATRTPLQGAVGNLVAVLLVSAALICLMLAWVRLQQGHGLLDALLSAVTLAVAALPEEFPVVLTFFLGVGVYRLAKRQALVRRAVVVENIGRVSCICSDKTGTLTEGRLQLTHQYPSRGLDPDRLLQLAAVASRRETGDPMDLAILDALGRPPDGVPVATFPFTEDRKRETRIVRTDGGLLSAVKGAPEKLLDMCTLADDARAAWLARVEQLAGSGHKVIACAWRELEAAVWPGGEPDHGLQFAGVLAFEDPVRAGVAEALEICREARIHVIMVTGDHPATARAVAQQVGLGGDVPTVIDGDAMEARLARGETAFLPEVDVIARAVPAQKLTLVRALQAQGEIVAVTGDGVNDVPALQAADIGIAMGERGTRSARDVAAIVLLDDNFRSIVRAIAEGRQLFANLQLSADDPHSTRAHRRADSVDRLPAALPAGAHRLAGADHPPDGAAGVPGHAGRCAACARGAHAAPAVFQPAAMADDRGGGRGGDRDRIDELPAQSRRRSRRGTRARDGAGGADRSERRHHPQPQPAAYSCCLGHGRGDSGLVGAARADPAARRIPAPQAAAPR
jgi:Ca2+-transporting ATPase